MMLVELGKHAHHMHRDPKFVIIVGLGEHAHLAHRKSWSRLECHLDKQ